MLAACGRAHGVQIAVAHQNRAFPAPRLAARLLAEGHIGRLRAMRAWSKHDERGGGLELLIHGTHMFDLMRHFAGEARWCHARVTVEGPRGPRGGRRPGATTARGGCWGTTWRPPSASTAASAGSFESMRSDDGGGNDYFRLELCGTAGVLTLWSADHPAGGGLLSRRPFVLPRPRRGLGDLPAPPCRAPRGRPPGPGRCTRPTTSWRHRPAGGGRGAGGALEQRRRRPGGPGDDPGGVRLPPQRGAGGAAPRPRRTHPLQPRGPVRTASAASRASDGVAETAPR